MQTLNEFLDELEREAEDVYASSTMSALDDARRIITLLYCCVKFYSAKPNEQDGVTYGSDEGKLANRYLEYVDTILKSRSS